jgi:SAM-dependent methyltransferase
MAPQMTDYHGAHFTDHPARAAVWRAIARYLSPYVPAGAEVVELGAGYCHWINHVDAGRRVAADVWPDVRRHAAPGVEARVLDVERELAALGDDAFDVALASNLLEHFTPDAAAGVVAGVGRLLKPGGRFILVQPNFRHAWRSYFDDYTHRAVFTDVSLPALLRAHGFAIERVEPRFLPYSMQGRRLPFAHWIVSAYLRSPFRPGAGQMLVVASKGPPHVR